MLNVQLMGKLINFDLFVGISFDYDLFKIDAAYIMMSLTNGKLVS